MPHLFGTKNMWRGTKNQLCKAFTCQVSVQSNNMNGNALLIACQDPSVGESGNTSLLYEKWRVANMSTFVSVQLQGLYLSCSLYVPWNLLYLDVTAEKLCTSLNQGDLWICWTRRVVVASSSVASPVCKHCWPTDMHSHVTGHVITDAGGHSLKICDEYVRPHWPPF